MLKKQTQKLLLSGLIALIFFSFLPVFNFPVADAQGPRGNADCNLNQHFAGAVQASKKTVHADESFDLYFKAIMPKDVADACNAQGAGSIEFSPWLYGGDCLKTDYAVNKQISYQATYYSEGNETGYRGVIKNTTLNQLGYQSTGFTTVNPCIYIYYNPKGGSATKAYYITSGTTFNLGVYATMDVVKDKTDHPVTNNFSGIPEAKLIGTSGGGEAVDYTKVGITIKGNANGNGLRSKYRVKWDDGDLNFGTTGGLDGIHMEWANEQSVLRYKISQFTLPKKDNAWGYDTNPYFVSASVYFNYAKNSKGNKIACKGTSFSTTCEGVVFRETDGSSKGAGHGAGALPADLSPVLKTGAWRDSDSGVKAPTADQKTKGNGGKPLGSIQLVALPAIIGYKDVNGLIAVFSWESIKRGIVDQSVTLIAASGDLTPFTVEVYANDEDIKTACKEEAKAAGKSEEDQKKCDDLNFAKFRSSESITQTTSSNETQNGGLTQTLYEFIVKVISQIVIWLTGLIYKIFAFFVVPVLNALLKVRPYQDQFVNIIYPGWLILRNLANIFFIVSLLVVGLRILFQQSASATARGFIMRLIIMALLVNFSLVIAQGIVGIADTIQAQFMPDDSRVIEALGSKLMVEPIQAFRTAVTGSETENFTQDKTIADTAKPIVLLVLAIAAFFSFIAIAAFLAVRLVALMVLYMVSPIAYVGYVMDETKKYAGDWWREFLKYAFITPILVFFLNMAAVVATITSTETGNVIHIEDSLSGDLVAGGLTIASHFMVLLFIFAGFKYARSSGVAGAKTITDYAKKGFDALTTRPAKYVAGAAKDLAKEQGKNFYIRNIKDGMLDPMAYKAAWKKSTEDKNKRMYSDRIMRKADRMTPAGLITNPKQALKYGWYKGSVGSTHALKEKMSKLDDKSKTMTQDERSRLDANLQETQGRNTAMNAIRANFLANGGNLTQADGQALANNLDAEANRVDAAKVARMNELQLEADTLRNNGNIDQARAVDAEREAVGKDFDERKEVIEKLRDEIQDVVNVTPAGAMLTMDDHLREDIADRLDKDIKDLGDELKNLNHDTEEDDRRRAQFGLPNGITFSERRALEKQIEELSEKAEDRAAPESFVVRQVRREREDEEKKKLEDIDDTDALIAMYNKALAKNNLPLASAIAKKLAAEGNYADLLKDKGKKNNFQSVQEVINNDFSKYSSQVRLQIMSEVGKLNEKNGNRAASGAVKIDKKSGRMTMSTEKDFNAKYEGYMSKRGLPDFKKMKKDDFLINGKLMKGFDKTLSKFKKLAASNQGDTVGYRKALKNWTEDHGDVVSAALKAPNIGLVDPVARQVMMDIVNPNAINNRPAGQPQVPVV